MESNFLEDFIGNCETNKKTEIPLKDLVDFDVSKLVNDSETTQLAGKLSLTQLLEYSLPRQNRSVCDAKNAEDLAATIEKQIETDIDRLNIKINGSSINNRTDYNTELAKLNKDNNIRYKINILITQTLYNVLTVTIFDFLQKYLHNKKIFGSVKNLIIDIVFKNSKFIVYVTAKGASTIYTDNVLEIPPSEVFFFSMSFNITQDTYTITQ